MVYPPLSGHQLARQSSLLVDHGTNCGITRDNVRIIATTDRRINLSGIDNHQHQYLLIVTVGEVCSSIKVKYLLSCIIMHTNLVTRKLIPLRIWGHKLMIALSLLVVLRNSAQIITMFYLAVVITDVKWENLLHAILTSDDNFHSHWFRRNS